MKILRRQEIIEDTWFRPGPDPDPGKQQAPFPEGDLLVSVECWRDRRGDLLARRGGRLGLRLEVTDKLEEFLGDLARFDLIALDFPKFSDGRPLSTCRLLRQRHAYRGELRAVGDVRRDQLLFMQRCGFDSFCLAPGQKPEAALHALHEFSAYYQAAVDELPSIFQLRRRAEKKRNDKRNGAGIQTGALTMPDFTDYKLGETRKPVELKSRLELQNAARAILSQARHQIDILSWDMEPWLYSQQEIVEQLRLRITQEQRPQVRVLVQDPNASTLQKHHLLHLAHRLSSFITIRKPEEKNDPMAEGFLIVDSTGYLHRPVFDRPEGRVDFNDPGRALKLLRDFEKAWQRGIEDPQLRSMRL